MDLPVTGYRVTQTEIDQTAGIVYQAAEEASDRRRTVPFSIIHEEEPHINLGRGLEKLDGVPEDLQFRRPGGGGYVEHDGTYCFGYAIPKERPKELIKSARDNLGGELEKLLEKQFDNPDYNPADGDIYAGTRQLAGIGVADIAEEFGNVTVVRACMYPELPEGRHYMHGSTTENAVPLRDFKDIQDGLENGFKEVEASEFVSDENRERAEQLQEEPGYRPAVPCFSRRNQLKN